MQRLLSFKILSKPLKKLPTGSPFLLSNVTKSFTPLPQNNPSKLPNTVFKTHFLSRLISHSYRTWLSHNVSSQTFCGVLKNTILGNKISNTHLLIRSRSFSDRGIQLIRAQFPRQCFDRRWIKLWRNYRRLLMPTVNAVVWRLIGANIFVFFLWKIADPIFMMKNFTISLDNFTSGRIYTFVTSAFSHTEDLYDSMCLLFVFGTLIGHLFGPEFLVKLYLAGASTGSIFFLVHKALVSSSSKLWDTNSERGLGGTGAVDAVVLFSMFLPIKEAYPIVLLGFFFISIHLGGIMERNNQSTSVMGSTVVAVLFSLARIRKGGMLRRRCSHIA